ncbi:hypothetical protein [Marinobacter sp. P4B1]|uniref:hypothetical protein n=1 Tax=Marinobacter sp. P4B1 TaxID=1119533 RepID=UPI00071CF829|nr:hypothetical protein [Marinobacter sp. P4B1]KRW83727.1 hypothetical protein AQ621_16895 [Marinobacter sp. P4B1]
MTEQDVSNPMQDHAMIECLTKDAQHHKKFSVARWLSFRSDVELDYLSRLAQKKRISEVENLLVLQVMQHCGFSRLKVSRMMILRCAQRLGLAASAEYCFRRDLAQITAEMTLRKDPRMNVRVLPMGKVMRQVMRGSPLISAIDD